MHSLNFCTSFHHTFNFGPNLDPPNFPENFFRTLYWLLPPLIPKSYFSPIYGNLQTHGCSDTACQPPHPNLKVPHKLVQGWLEYNNKNACGLKPQPLKDFILGRSPSVNRELLTHILTNAMAELKNELKCLLHKQGLPFFIKSFSQSGGIKFLLKSLISLL